jgi:hypothetical protein
MAGGAHALKMFPLALCLAAMRAMPANGSVQLHFSIANPALAAIIGQNRLHAPGQQKSSQHQRGNPATSSVHFSS